MGFCRCRICTCLDFARCEIGSLGTRKVKTETCSSGRLTSRKAHIGPQPAAQGRQEVLEPSSTARSTRSLHRDVWEVSIRVLGCSISSFKGHLSGRKPHGCHASESPACGVSLGSKSCLRSQPFAAQKHEIRGCFTFIQASQAAKHR